MNAESEEHECTDIDDHSDCECTGADPFGLLDEPPQTEEEWAKVQEAIEREADERVAQWPADARDYLERMNYAYEHVCNHLKAAWVQRNRALSALRSLLPLLDRIGYSTPKEQEAMREARAVVGEVIKP